MADRAWPSDIADAGRWRHLPPARQHAVIAQLEVDAVALTDALRPGDPDDVRAFPEDLRRAAAALRFLAGLGGSNPRGLVP